MPPRSRSVVAVAVAVAAGLLLLLFLLLLGGCSSGDGGGFVVPTTVGAPTSSTLAVTTTAVPTTVPGTDPPGSVTLRATGFTVPDIRAGGSGLRLVVRSAGARLTVRRKGGGGQVSVCPIAGPTGPVRASECADLGPGATVSLASVGGVEVRALGPEAAVDEVSVTYLPTARSTTVVTPARPAGACAARACEVVFSFVPGGAGAFVMDGQPGGGRPRMVLTQVPSAGGAGSNRTLATVEGGGFLSIRGTVEAGSEARLLHHEETTAAVFPVTAEILWP